ncbi:hypothetical protein [Allorhodopirellula solitaria]|nr:hypothetical protein [Allorhodopirellula solitaria]
MLTVILPRMELGHLREWLRHYAARGFRHFWIFSIGHVVLDQRFGNNGEKYWKKQPEADYRLDLSNDDIDQCLENILEDARRDFGLSISFERVSANPKGVGTVQKQAASSVLNRAISDVDWLGFFDVDELLVGDLSVFDEVPTDVAVLEVHQRVFETRWQNGSCRPMSAVHRHYGNVEFNQKLFVRPQLIQNWSRVHAIHASDRHGKVEIADSKRLRFGHFRGKPKHKVETDAHASPSLEHYARLALRPESDTMHRPPFDVILGVMRSGSTLLGHLLSSMGYGRYAGETHTNISHERGVQNAIKIIDEKVRVSKPLWLPTIDKVLHREHVGGARFLSERVDTVYLLHRHPMVIWRSLKDTGWERATLTYLLSHARWLNEITEIVPAHKLIGISYYDIVDPSRTHRKFNRALDAYELLPTTGKRGWGDPIGVIADGRIRIGCEQEDLADAANAIGDIPPELEQAITEHEQLIKRLLANGSERQLLAPPASLNISRT